MKLKSIVTVNLGLYMDIRTEIEIDVPDELKNEQLVKYLYAKYWGLLTPQRLNQQVDAKKIMDSARDSAEHDVGGLIDFGDESIQIEE